MAEMTREQALKILERIYGAGTMEGDPEWVEEMVGYMLEDPDYARQLAEDAPE